MPRTLAESASILREFIGPAQLQVIGDSCRGEEREWFKAKLHELAETVTIMSKTYEQDGKGDRAVVYLHYFAGGCDWWITERDIETEQHQAFGLADLGQGGEIGYISIRELMSAGAEIDLHWTPKTLAKVRYSNPR